MADTGVTTPSVPEVSAKVSKVVNHIKPLFTQFVADFTALASKRDDLAPKFMRAFRQWKSETKGTFIDFVRVLDPTVPGDRTGYRQARSYQAADYLRTKSNRLEAAEAGEGQQGADNVVRVTASQMIARVVASVTPLLSDEGVKILWKTMQDQLGFSERQIAVLKKLTDDLPPLVKLKAPAGTNVSHTLKATAGPKPAPVSQAA